MDIAAAYRLNDLYRKCSCSIYACRSIRQTDASSCDFVSAIGLTDTLFEFPRSRLAAKNRTPLSHAVSIMQTSDRSSSKRRKRNRSME